MDPVNGSANDDTISGTFGSATATENTLSAGDLVDGSGGTDTMNLVALAGNTSAPVTVQNVENINVTDTVGATVNAVLFENAPTISFSRTLDGNTSIVNNADIAGTYGLSGAGDLDVNFAAAGVTGTSDTAKASVSTVGSSTNSVALNVDSANSIEAVSVATTGTNFFSVNGGSGAATVTVTGDGTNTISGVSGAGSLAFDASAATAKQTVTLTGVGVGDNIKGGAATDDYLNFSVGSGTSLATIEGFETIEIDFTAGGTFNATNVTGVTRLDVDNVAGTATVSGLAATATTLNYTETDVTADDLVVTYAGGAAADLTLNIGDSDSSSATTLAVDGGDITVGNLAGAYTINSIGEADNTIDALSVAAATSLTITGTKGLTQVGPLTATAATAMTVTANADSVSLGTVTSDEDVTEVRLDASGAEANDITITDLAMDHVDKITVTADGGADVTITDISFDDRNKADNADNAVTVSLTATSAESVITIGALTDGNIGSADQTIDLLTLAGAGDIDMNNADMGATGADISVIDASGLTGQLDLDGGDFTQSATITLGNAASGHTNTVVTGGGDDVVTGGTGADNITTGAGADVITAGAGADIVNGGAAADVITLGAGADTVIFGDEGASDSVSDFATGAAGDQIDIDVSAFNTDNLSDSTGTPLADATAAGLINYTVGAASAANATGSNILFVTNTTGINSITDVNTALGNNNLTLDGGGTDFGNTEGLVTVFFDADDGNMVIGYLEDSDAGTGGVFDGTNSTFVEIATLGMTATAYGNLTSANFDFI